MLLSWCLGFAGSLLIAWSAYRKRSLTTSGTIAAIVLGTCLFALGSLAWYGTLIAFFISSSALSKVKHRRKEEAESGYEKSGNRDVWQVAANGGLGLILCLFNVLSPNPLWWIAYVGVMAAVTADTWATEIGGMSSKKPRSILTWKVVPTGTSGGVTLLGLAASLLGGLFVGLVAGLFSYQPTSDLQQLDVSLIGITAIGALAGLLGSLADSTIGALLQVMYRCQVCGKEVEKRTHCGASTYPIRGIKWMNNDWVNLLASIIGGLFATAIVMFLHFL
ncbi:DUF92 domain-containing protein [Paenibacillus sp. N1-5-1-14]|uniref:DUF92 domain-containing protein n=1 Tax=Paenibacillus radicibacter TaxID=2972488 RepID=UPI002159B0C1|nr:DUF92 domain-containing protein [Paenibacillus radicibacter]MCR8643869.1 DUF92 domain-containing protein [Paenibacillus radicibacter]